MRQNRQERIGWLRRRIAQDTAELNRRLAVEQRMDAKRQARAQRNQEALERQQARDKEARECYERFGVSDELLHTLKAQRREERNTKRLEKMGIDDRAAPSNPIAGWLTASAQ